MKQTAVEWFQEQIIKIVNGKCELSEIQIFEQAKEMEKEQIIDAFVECWKENMPEGYECKQSAEYYYNETYEQINQE
jgi:HEPN domain-containing protein